MAWLGRRTQNNLTIGLLALFAWGGAAWGQAVIIAIPPSNLNPGEKSEGFLGFGCYDIHTLVFINCQVTVKLDRLDPAAMIPPFFGGHLGHAPQPVGTVRDSNGTGPGGDFVAGDTLKGFSVVYTAPEASGQFQVTTRLAPPPSYICLSEPDPDGSGACKHVRRINVGIQGLREMSGDSFVFKPRPSTDLHPRAHFGTVALQQGITLIGKTYIDLTGGRRPRVTDISLPVGGLFDICGTYSAGGKCTAAPNGGHAWHRTGRDVDFSATDDAGQSIDCLFQTTDAMIKTFKEAKATFRKCYDDGHYHVRFQ